MTSEETVEKVKEILEIAHMDSGVAIVAKEQFSTWNGLEFTVYVSDSDLFSHDWGGAHESYELCLIEIRDKLVEQRQKGIDALLCAI